MMGEAPEKYAEINLLFDFYGELLPEKQQEVFRLHHQEDWSLGEIGEEMGITRQGVHDFLKRSEQRLLGYEEKLGLARRFLRTEKQKKEAIAALGKLEQELGKDSALWGRLEEIRRAMEDWE